MQLLSYLKQIGSENIALQQMGMDFPKSFNEVKCNLELF